MRLSPKLCNVQYCCIAELSEKAFQLYLFTVFQTTHTSCYNMDNTTLHLAHNGFENNAKVAFSELRKDQTFSDVQLVCDDDSGVAVVTSAHKVILAASSPFFNSVLRGLDHPKPLLYLKGIPQK